MLNFDWLAGLSVKTAKGIFLGLYLLILSAVWLLSKAYILRSVENPRPWHNLKWWTAGILLLLSAIYLYF